MILTMRGITPLPRLIVLAIIAACQLARARFVLHRTTPSDVIRLNAAAKSAAPTASRGSAASSKRCDEVAAVIPRIAVRVPWRADCLVQVLAGHRWLQRNGIPSEIVIGTAKPTNGSLEAHAWLVHNGKVLLGGDITRFQPLLGPDAAVPGDPKG